MQLTAARAVKEEIADSKTAEAVEEVYGVQMHTALLPKAVKADTTHTFTQNHFLNEQYTLKLGDKKDRIERIA